MRGSKEDEKHHEGRCMWLQTCSCERALDSEHDGSNTHEVTLTGFARVVMRRSPTEDETARTTSLVVQCRTGICASKHQKVKVTLTKKLDKVDLEATKFGSAQALTDV
jgi:hypothetical protein